MTSDPFAKIRSVAKLELVELLRTTKFDEIYTFQFHGSRQEALQYIHRMRVELSRFRKTVLEKGEVVKHFKLITIDISEPDNLGVRTVQIKKTRSANNVSHLVNPVFQALKDELSDGEKIK